MVKNGSLLAQTTNTGYKEKKKPHNLLKQTNFLSDYIGKSLNY